MEYMSEPERFEFGNVPREVPLITYEELAIIALVDKIGNRVDDKDEIG